MFSCFPRNSEVSNWSQKQALDPLPAIGSGSSLDQISGLRRFQSLFSAPDTWNTRDFWSILEVDRRSTKFLHQLLVKTDWGKKYRISTRFLPRRFRVDSIMDRISPRFQFRFQVRYQSENSTFLSTRFRCQFLVGISVRKFAQISTSITSSNLVRTVGNIPI